jgi:hypothetical protein
MVEILNFKYRATITNLNVSVTNLKIREILISHGLYDTKKLKCKVNTEKAKYITMSCHQNEGKSTIYYTAYEQIPVASAWFMWQLQNSL